MFMRHDAIIVGGGSGTTPAHIRHVAEEVTPLKPRTILERLVALRQSGLEPFGFAS